MSNVSITGIGNLIMGIDNMDDIRRVRGFLKSQTKEIGRDIKSSLRAGQSVKVVRRNKVETGEVIKVNRTRAVVRIDGKSWNVPLQMIETEISLY